MSKIENWRDSYGKITFTYGDKNWSVADKPGQGIIIQTADLLLDVEFKQYPRPDFVAKAIEDFNRCVGQTAGKWLWEAGAWSRL